jgi:Protein of unknown function (DUF2786)
LLRQLLRKAAATTFPHEAAACRAKAEALRDRYGLWHSRTDRHPRPDQRRAWCVPLGSSQPPSSAERNESSRLCRRDGRIVTPNSVARTTDHHTFRWKCE